MRRDASTTYQLPCGLASARFKARAIALGLPCFQSGAAEASGTSIGGSGGPTLQIRLIAFDSLLPLTGDAPKFRGAGSSEWARV